MRAIAIKQPVAFCALLGKLIPKDMNLALPVVQPKPWSKASMVEVGRRRAFVLAVADHDADKKVEPTGQAVSKAGAIKRVRTSSGGNAVK